MTRPSGTPETPKGRKGWKQNSNDKPNNWATNLSRSNPRLHDEPEQRAGVPWKPCRRLDLLRPLLTSALRSDCLSTTSVARATQDRPPGVSSAAFRAQSPDLRFASLDGYGLCGKSPARPTLAPYTRFLSIDSHICLALPSDPASRR